MFGAIDDASRSLVNSVCPLFVLQAPQRPFLIGSAVPVQIGRASVLVTAAHVLESYGRASVLTLGHGESLVLGGERRGFGHRRGSTVDVDLAVIVLGDDERAKLRERYTFLYSSTFASTGSPEEVTFFAIAGYPQSRNKFSPRLKKFGTTVANYFISRSQLHLSAVSSSDKFASVHFAVGAPRDGAIGLDGSRVGFPSPAGMSGGGVWRLRFPRDAARLPTGQLVGIGIEYLSKPGAFVCTRIEHVLPMVSDLA